MIITSHKFQSGIDIRLFGFILYANLIERKNLAKDIYAILLRVIFNFKLYLYINLCNLSLFHFKQNILYKLL